MGVMIMTVQSGHGSDGVRGAPVETGVTGLTFVRPDRSRDIAFIYDDILGWTDLRADAAFSATTVNFKN